MTGNIKGKAIIILLIGVIFNFPVIAYGIEKEGKISIKKRQTVKNEEDTMLNIMPYLRIPKKLSTKFSLIQELEYFDNYNLSKDDKEGRLASITSPTVSLRYPIGRTYLEGGYAYGYTYYIRHDDQVHRHHAKLKAYHRPTRRFSMGLSEEFLRNDHPEEEKDIDVKSPGSTFDTNTLNAQAKYEISRRWRCGIEGTYSFIKFEEKAEDADPDRTEFGVGGDMEYVIDRQSKAGIGYNFLNTVFNRSDDKNSNKHTVYLRYSQRAREGFTVVARGGYDFIDYEKSGDIIGVSFGTDLDFDISRFTKFLLKYNYAFNNSSRDDYRIYRYHSLGASFKHHLTPRLVLTADSSYDLWLYDPKYNITNSNENSDKLSHIIRFSCTINYKLTKKIDIGLNYHTNAKFSDFSNDTYLANYYIATIRMIF